MKTNLLIPALLTASAALCAETRPNIVFVLTDDQRADTAGFASDGAVWTPGMDRLRDRAMRFTRAYPVLALCSPSRAAILTGQYGSRNGVTGLGGPLANPNDSFARMLKDAGYQTAVSGKWHLKTSPAEAGFDWAVTFYSNGTWFNRAVNNNGTTVKPPELVDLYCANESVRFLRERDKTRPFFLWHCTQLPHMNNRLKWPASDKNLARYNEDEMPLPPTWKAEETGKPDWIMQCRNRTQAINYGYSRNPKKIQRHIREYRATVSDLDDALQPLWAELDAQNLWGSTIVVFLSDNGWMLGEHGLTSKVLAYEPATRVPLLIAAPGLEGGQTCDRLVCNIDLAPTLLELIGLPPASSFDGKSFAALLQNPEAPFREGMVYEGNSGYGGVPLFGAWITPEAKIIQTFGETNLDPFTECYDLQNDPDEAINITSPEKLDAVRKEAARQIQQHFQ